MDICWECPQHSFSLFWSTLSLFSFEKLPLPISQPGALVGLAPPLVPGYGPFPHPKGLIRSTFLTSSFPLPHYSDLFRERHMTHLGPMRECEFRACSLSLEWYGIKMWGLEQLQPFTTIGKPGNSGLTAWSPERKPIRRQKGEGDNLSLCN